MAHRDGYTAFVSRRRRQEARRPGSGCPSRCALRRYEPGRPLVDGPVLVGGHGDTPALAALRDGLTEPGRDAGRRRCPRRERLGGVVVDLTAAPEPADLEALRATSAPALKRLGRAGGSSSSGATPRRPAPPRSAPTRRALEGIARSVGQGAAGRARPPTSCSSPTAPRPAALGTVRFLLSGAFGLRRRPGRSASAAARPSTRRLATARSAGKVAVVTGAARGIGAAIAGVLARDGATVVVRRRPVGRRRAWPRSRTGSVAPRCRLDVTAPDAGRRILDHARTRHGGLDIVVHNAGITRDKLLANMDADRWASVIDVNLGSILRMNEAILGAGRPAPTAAHVVLRLVDRRHRGQPRPDQLRRVQGGRHRAGRRLRGRRGAAARAASRSTPSRPGFIETEMTARIPFATRELGRRLNSLQQGGLPVDVAETIAWFARTRSRRRQRQRGAGLRPEPARAPDVAVETLPRSPSTAPAVRRAAA